MTYLAIGRMFVGAVLPEWLMSFEELEKPAPKPDGQPNWLSFNVMRQVVHAARNDIVNSFLKSTDCKYLFFIDDDICLPPTGLRQLLADSIEHDAPIVTGLYIQRGEPHLPVIYRKTDDGRHIFMTKYIPGLQEVDACGAGCLLIRRDVLETIGSDWFSYGDYGVSEDMAFCMRVKAAGYKIALDASVRCNHLSIIKVAPEMFEDRKEHGFYNYDNTDTQHWAEDVKPWQDAPKPEVVAPLTLASVRAQARPVSRKKKARRKA
jgi:hypothetical protein